MSISRTILTKTLVRPFYKQNAGLFAFLIFIMVAAVGRANGVGLLEYHFSLIRAMLTHFPFLLFTLCAWFLYAVKCARFISDTLKKRDHAFLYLLVLKKTAFVYWQLFAVQVMILLPVLLYAFIAVVVGVVHHWWLHSSMIILFFIAISVSGAFHYQYIIQFPNQRRVRVFGNFQLFSKSTSYWIFLVRFIWKSRALLFIVIKISGCLILYGLITGNTADRSGLQMTILFYSFGLLGHGVLIYFIRSMEENSFSFYRGMPVSLLQRFVQYGILYFLLMIPEIIVIQWLTPTYIRYRDAILFVFYGYTVLIFLNSLLFIRLFPKFEYLKIVTGLYLMIFIAVLTGIFPFFCAGLFLLAIHIFFRYYYRFEMS
jgi:hypothetical protein